jgi:hypothetical protein
MSLLQEIEKLGLADCEANRAIILLSDLEHEVNCLLSNHAIDVNYSRLDQLKNARKKALQYVKGAI